MEALLQDLRHAARALVKTPGFTIVAVVTLALGIGANTAVFSVVNGVLLSPLPYREPERLVKLWESLPSMAQIMVAYPDYKDWKVRARVFDDIALYSPFRTMTMTGGELPERVGVGLATGNLFGVLGMSPIMGRDFLTSGDQPGAERVALATSGFWQRRFGSERGILGR